MERRGLMRSLVSIVKHKQSQQLSKYGVYGDARYQLSNLRDKRVRITGNIRFKRKTKNHYIFVLTHVFVNNTISVHHFLMQIDVTNTKLYDRLSVFAQYGTRVTMTATIKHYTRKGSGLNSYGIASPKDVEVEKAHTLKKQYPDVFLSTTYMPCSEFQRFKTFVKSKYIFEQTPLNINDDVLEQTIAFTIAYKTNHVNTFIHDETWINTTPYLKPHLIPSVYTEPNILTCFKNIYYVKRRIVLSNTNQYDKLKNKNVYSYKITPNQEKQLKRQIDATCQYLDTKTSFNSKYNNIYNFPYLYKDDNHYIVLISNLSNHHHRTMAHTLLAIAKYLPEDYERVSVLNSNTGLMWTITKQDLERFL